MNVVVIGGGVVGLSVAYNLARAGAEVTVFERKYPLYGASGRNSGGITPLLSNESLIKLAARSIELYDHIQSEVDFNFLFRKDGYIKVAQNDEDLSVLEREMRLQKAAGVDVREIDPFEIRSIVPAFNPESVIGGVIGEGGVIFPWPVIWGLVKGCKNLGVEIRVEAEVNGILIGDGEVEGVKVNDEVVRADYIVNAAGAWSNQFSNLAGIKSENRVIKEEICVIESLKPFIDPYLLNVSNGVYLSQSARGEVVGGVLGRETGVDNALGVKNLNTKSSLEFLFRYAKGAVEMIPRLRGLSVLRQWAGVYDTGQDGFPVVGESQIRGFIQANGMGRLGMTIGPAVGEIVAQVIFKGSGMEEFSPIRFSSDGFKN
jgi:sarcosine oxidase subunit beta